MKYILIFNCIYWLELHLFVYLFVDFLSSQIYNPLEQKEHCSPKYLQDLEQGPAHSKCEIGIYLMDE